MMGAMPEEVAAAMVEVGADAVGANCGVGTSQKLSKNYANRLSSVCVKLIQIMVSTEVGQSS
jgi:methionine synthase I (cobalamin-dependent)